VNEKINQIRAADDLADVVSKLSVVSDFMQMLDDNFSLRTRTPEGLAVIIGECIGTLSRIGGLHEQPAA